MRRHEALRTTFAERDGQPVQVIAPPGALDPAASIDLAACPPAARGRAARGLARRRRARPFDLARGPLLRAVLLRLGERRSTRSCSTMHHIVSDGWSMGVLVREIAALYGA